MNEPFFKNERSQLEREGREMLDAVTAQLRRELVENLEQMLNVELDRFQRSLVSSLANLGVEAVAPQLGNLAAGLFGNSAFGAALGGSLTAGLAGIVTGNPVAPERLARGALSRTQSASAALNGLATGGSTS